MKIDTKNLNWTVSFEDGYVQLLQIDYRLGIFIADHAESIRVHIGSPFRFRGPDGMEAEADPEDSPTMAPALQIANGGVRSLAVSETGSLQIDFANGASLFVTPDEHYEAWEMLGDGFWLISTPGGGLSLFGQPKTDDVES